MLQARSPFSLVLFIARSSCLLFSPSSLARSAASFLRVSSPAAFSTDSPYSYLLLFRSHATPHRVEEVAGLNYGEYSYYPLAFSLSLFLSLLFSRLFVPSYYRIMDAMRRMQEQQSRVSLILDIRAICLDV